MFDLLDSAKEKNIYKCNLLKDQIKFGRFETLPTGFLIIRTLASCLERLTTGIRFFFKK